jgi:phage-related protein
VVTFAESSRLLRQSLGERELENYVRRINGFNTALGGLTKTVINSSDILRSFSVGIIKTTDRSFRALSKAITATSSDLKPFSLSFIEFLTVASPLLTQLGLAMQFSESSAAQMTGTILILAGVLSGAFTSAIAFAMREVGSFTQSIGEGLINVLEDFDAKATKAETVTRQFTFVLQNFADTLGERTVGSLEEWNKTLEQIDETTNFTTQSIQKSIKLLISEGTALGLTFQDNQRILRESTDIASATGKDLESVTQALLSGLAGQSQAAFALGINLRESALLHDNNAHSIDSHTKKLSENEKLQKRLSIITKRANILEGASQSLANTREGQLIRYNKALSELQENLGSTNILVTEFNNAQILTLNAINSLPKSIFQVISAFGQLSGVFLIVTGFLIKWGLLISGLLTLFKALSAVVSANVIIQNALTAAVNRANAALGLQAVQVTSLTTLFASLKAIIVAFGTTGIVAILSKMASVLASVSVAVAAFTLSIAPLLIKIGIVVASIIAFWKAIKDLGSVMNSIKLSISALLSPFRELLILMGLLDSEGNSTVKILESIESAFSKIVDTIKLVVLGLTKIISTASLLGTSFFADLQQVFGASDESIKRTNESMFDLEASLGKLDQKIGDIVLSFGEAKEETEKVSENVKSIKDEIDQTSLDKLLDQITNIRDANNDLKNEIRGIGLNQVEQIKLARDIEIEKLSVLEKQLAAAGKLEKFQKDIDTGKALQSQLASLKVSKLRADAVESIADANADIAKQMKLAGLEGEELAQTELQFRLAAVDAYAKELEAKGLLTAEAQKQLDIQKDLIAQQGKSGKKDEGGMMASMGEAASTASNVFSSVFEAGAEMYGSVLDLAGDNMSLQLTKSANQLVDGLMNVVENFDQILMNALDMFDSVIDALPGIIEGIMDKLPAIIDKAIASLLNLIDKIPAMIENIMAKLPEIITQLMDNLPTIIEKFIQMIPKALNSIIQRIPEIIMSILDRLPEVVEVFVEEFIAAMGDIIASLVDTFITKGGIFKIAASLVKAIIKLVPALIRAIANGLKRALGSIFKGFSIKMPSTKPLEESVERIFGKVVSGATKVSEEIFSVVDIPTSGRDLEDKAKNDVKKVQEAADEIVKQVSGIWDSFLAMLKKAWMWVWEKILEPIVNLVKKAWLWVYNTIIRPMARIVKKAFGIVSDLFKNMGKTVSKAFGVVVQWLKDVAEVFKSAFNVLVEWGKTLFEIVGHAWEGIMGFFNNLKNLVMDAFNSVINFWKHIFKGNVKEAFAEVFDFFRKLPETMQNIGKPLIEAYEKTFGTLIEFFQKQFLPLMEKAVKPFQNLFAGVKGVFEQALAPFTNFFSAGGLGNQLKSLFTDAFSPDLIKNPFQQAFDQLNPGNLLKKMFNIDSGMGKKGGVENLIGIDVPFVSFNQGGIVPGTSKRSGDSRSNDTVPAM